VAGPFRVRGYLLPCFFQFFTCDDVKGLFLSDPFFPPPSRRGVFFNRRQGVFPATVPPPSPLFFRRGPPFRPPLQVLWTILVVAPPFPAQAGVLPMPIFFVQATRGRTSSPTGAFFGTLLRSFPCAAEHVRQTNGPMLCSPPPPPPLPFDPCGLGVWFVVPSSSCSSSRGWSPPLDRPVERFFAFRSSPPFFLLFFPSPSFAQQFPSKDIRPGQLSPARRLSLLLPGILGVLSFRGIFFFFVVPSGSLFRVISG